jgi:hypothetical protein
MTMLSKRGILALFCGALLLSFNASLAAQCTADPWLSTLSYPRGTIVSHLSHEWRAKRNTAIGVAPGTHKPTWADRGACETDPVEPPPPPPPPEATPLQIFGVWHCGNSYCDWSVVRDMTAFDTANNWIIERGDGSGLPSVNLVVLSFLNPLEVLRMSDEGSSNPSGVPVGMTQAIVEYFKGAGIRVMMSIGGVTYTDFWDEALNTDAGAIQLGLNAAAIADHFGVGIEIDYEQNSNPNLDGLEMFITAYRSVHPYDEAGTNHAARLTIDLAAGGRYLQDLNRYATIHWLNNGSPVLDYANAMVHRASGTPAHWQEHVDGMPTYNPVIPPKAPNRFTGGLYVKGNMDNCTDFIGSEQKEHADFVQTVAPNGEGATNGMLGYMFWAAEYPSARKNYTATVPPNTCEGGMGVAASPTQFAISVPMEPLRQE